ncbi:hypothetical protein BG006_009741 [Podila minutissima]|uniref:Uncharacterized protein n=1 Tax=Podila minutissima TaxID=64525 RepID=A0A9P5VJ72_9FUNG|nr:hypothetical protein BG006_009741 [Podila minutissima]
MDPTANNVRNSQNGRDPDSKGKGKASNTNTSSLLGSIAGSAKSLASALDPTRPQSGYGASSSVLGSASGGDTKQQAAFSSSTSYQQATRALETLQSTSSLSTSGTVQQSGFRSVGPKAGGGGGGMAMDWDSFLSSSESTIDDKPYQPSSFSAFTDLRSTGESSRPIFPTTTTATETAPVRALPPLANAYQSHLSQPMNLTPANHAAFLEYLKSTATRSLPQPSGQVASVTTSSGPTASSSANQQPFQRQTPAYQPYTPLRSSAQPLFSRDVQFQQQQDGGDVLAFLNSASYTDFVDEVESAGLEKHQHERRQFHYAPGMVSQPGLSHLMSLIQHLPSERQDIVQYLLQQGTYTDDVYSMPFGWDGRDEAASLQATLLEQDQFLRRQQNGTGSGRGEQGEDATTAEMERVLAEIVADAKKEVSTGQTQGKALDRLLMVRSHITMGTKL